MNLHNGSVSNTGVTGEKEFTNIYNITLWKEIIKDGEKSYLLNGCVDDIIREMFLNVYEIHDIDTIDGSIDEPDKEILNDTHKMKNRIWLIWFVLFFYPTNVCW